MRYGLEDGRIESEAPNKERKELFANVRKTRATFSQVTSGMGVTKKGGVRVPLLSLHPLPEFKTLRLSRTDQQRVGPIRSTSLRVVYR